VQTAMSPCVVRNSRFLRARNNGGSVHGFPPSRICRLGIDSTKRAVLPGAYGDAERPMNQIES
jgi:hypothetical protein